jgi:hypothetical protein
MNSPRVGHRFLAEVECGGYYLRLVSEATPFGAEAVVFDMSTRKHLAREWVDDLDNGKKKAEEIVIAVLGKRPPIRWKEITHI